MNARLAPANPVESARFQDLSRRSRRCACEGGDSLRRGSRPVPRAWLRASFRGADERNALLKLPVSKRTPNSCGRPSRVWIHTRRLAPHAYVFTGVFGKVFRSISTFHEIMSHEKHENSKEWDSKRLLTWWRPDPGMRVLILNKTKASIRIDRSVSEFYSFSMGGSLLPGFVQHMPCTNFH